MWSVFLQIYTVIYQHANSQRFNKCLMYCSTIRWPLRCSTYRNSNYYVISAASCLKACRTYICGFSDRNKWFLYSLLFDLLHFCFEISNTPLSTKIVSILYCLINWDFDLYFSHSDPVCPKDGTNLKREEVS